MKKLLVDQLKDKYPEVYKEFITDNIHQWKEEEITGRNVLDIGANVGFVSILYTAFGAKQVISVESHPKTFEELKNNVAPYPNIVPVNVAAFNGLHKYVTILEEDNNSGIAKTIPAENIKGPGDVEAWDLNKFIRTYFDPNDTECILKVDTEGAEYDILLYASGLDIRKFKYIYLDSHQVNFLKHSAARKSGYIKTYLSFLGFEILSTEQVCCWNWNPDGSVKSCTNVEDNIAMKWRRIDPWK